MATDSQTTFEFLEAALESSLDGIILVNSQGRILSVNQSFRDMYGFGCCPLVGTTLEQFDQLACGCFHCADDRHDFLREIFNNDKGPLRREFHVQSPEERVISFYARPVVDREGNAQGRISIHIDITDERKRQHELEKANQHIREAQTQLAQSEKMASLGLLVAGIAHEINTPIGSINSNNDILIRAVSKMREFIECDQCPAEIRNHPEVVKIMGILESINQNNRVACERIIEIIRSLRRFARLDEAEWKKANILEGLDSTLTLVRHQLKNRIQVIKEYGVLPEIDCYPNQLNQVFMNILVNAAQAMPGKGVLRLKAWQEGAVVKISISDSGMGIPKENLARIFDPGFTTKGVGVGTGLGLSICYKIIQDHQGKIEVESDVGKGSTFTVTLPIQQGAS
jgi:two-component system, NtrC family, sensor kinase